MKDVAVLLATYNGGRYLKQQLDSLLEQTYQNFRIVIHDDGSTDDTVDIINEYRENYPNKIEIYFGHPCGGPKENFLWMLTRVHADYYMFCDQDDVWLKEKVERSVEKLEKTEFDLIKAKTHMDTDEFDTPICVFTDMKVVDEELNILSDSFIRYIGRLPSNTAYTQIIIDNPAAGCTMCFNKPLRDLVVKMLPYLDLKNIPMHDALILELASINGKVVAIDEPLAYYRQTGQNAMGAITESDSEKAGRNIQDIKQGSFFEKKKEFVSESRLFANEIIKADFLPKDKRDVLMCFANIGRKNKLQRMYFYRKHNFTRAVHNLWFRLFV
ncbi:rhamnosyltransferase [Pseudobutyrivibrio sp. ACV-2]|uniref:glycosyltransferase family 2 protein n=1 Tax=Pseudobutyrivibrio sp. ACV-2 TaxID=1520801 RepID=UPI00089AF37A|nr:glycosyltransferase family 2 protein [Pseudobutyrivibrio sp. ACV-2]SEA00161.1 rhamnosyltransferase [Pseudobutyrivibrio sp. ACV-2]